MPHFGHAYLGTEPQNFVAAAAVRAGLVPADHVFVALESADVYTGSHTSVVHLDGTCANGRLFKLTGTELLELAEAGRRTTSATRTLCGKCQSVLLNQLPDAEVLPYGTLYRLAAAVRLTDALDWALGQLSYGPRQAVADVRADIVKAVGEARIFAAQYAPDGAETERTVLEHYRAQLAEVLDEVTAHPVWVSVQAELNARVNKEWAWTVLAASHPGMDGPRYRHYYDAATTLFAAGATLETHMPRHDGPAEPVVRHLRGLSVGIIGDPFTVSENGRSVEAMRRGFEGADASVFSDLDGRDAWFDAVEAACTPAPAQV